MSDTSPQLKEEMKEENQELYGEQRKGYYILKDCQSETGTWVKIGSSYCRNQNQTSTINIHQNLSMVFKVGKNQFVFELDQESADIIDEVYFWAKDTQRRHKLEYDLLQILEENQMRFKSL